VALSVATRPMIWLAMRRDSVWPAWNRSVGRDARVKKEFAIAAHLTRVARAPHV
jgi:hypothetical protein